MSPTQISVVSEIERALTVLFRPARIKRAHEMLSRQAGIDLDQPAYTALVCLEAGEPMRMSDLAEAGGVDISTMSRLVDRLLAAGLVEPGSLSADRRAVVLQLSERGRRLLHAMRVVRQEALGQVLAGWAEDERETFARLLSRFVESLERFVREKAASEVAGNGDFPISTKG